MKAKAQWAENHGFVWFSVLDHMIQIPRGGAPDEPVLEGWTVLAGWPPSPAASAFDILREVVKYVTPASPINF